MRLRAVPQRGHCVPDLLPVLFLIFFGRHPSVGIILKRDPRTRQVALPHHGVQIRHERQIVFVLALQIRKEIEFPGRPLQILLRQRQSALRLFQAKIPVQIVELVRVLRQLIRPGFRVRQTLQERVEAGDHVPHGKVSAGIGVTVQESAERRIVRRVAVFHQLVQGFLLQKLRLCLVADLQTGFYADNVIVAMHDLQREFVERADVRPADQRQLGADAVPAVAGDAFFGQLPVQILVDALLHLRRGSVRIRDDQHVLQADVLVQQQFRHALHEHGRLAGSRGSGNQEALMPPVDRIFLLLCPFRSGVGHIVFSQFQLYTTERPNCGTIEAQPDRFRLQKRGFRHECK